jgi:monoamine oxidase
MGRATRIALCFREPFWEGRLRAPFFLRVPRRAFPVFWSGPAENTRMIVAWAGGPSSDALMASGEGPADLGATALAILAEVFGLRAAALHDLLECTAHHDWMRDAWSHGVYSYPRVGYSQSAHLLREPVGETLFIAGEATSEPPGSGTVEGALASGQRAASDVAALL